jgi:hypothetical protein
MANDLNNNNKKIINIYLDMDYEIYKNRIKKYIIEHITLIYNIFDEQFNDNLTKLYILYKKKLLEKDNVIYIYLLIEYINYLKKIDYVDQQEYFYLILKLLNIYILIINKILIDDKYTKLINLHKMKEKIIKNIKLIENENIVIKLFLLFINNNNKNSKKNIILIGEKLAFDFFIYWNSENIYEIIISNINIKNNELLTSLKKYKDDFIKSYDNKVKILKDLYSEHTNIKLNKKYVFVNKNTQFNELINDINIIDNEIL